MNSLSLYALAAELDAALSGAAVVSVRRFPAAATISFSGAPAAHCHLLLHLREPDLFFSKEPLAPEPHARPEMGAAEGRAVKGVKTRDLERTLIIELGSLPRFGASDSASLVIDLAPTVRPLALFDESGERVLASVGSRGGRARGRGRPLPPKPYSLLSPPASAPAEILVPAPEGPAGADAPEHTRRWSAARSLASELAGKVAGIDPALASALVREADGDPERAWSLVLEVAGRLAKGSWSWHLYRFPEPRAPLVYPFELPIGQRGEAAKDFSDALASRARESLIPGYVEHLRRLASRRARTEAKRLERLRGNLENDLADAARSSEYRHFGDLLVTHRQLLRTGLSEIVVKDFSGERSVAIPLDPARSPERNIRLYFTKAKKGERGAFIMKSRASAVERDIEERRREIARIEGMRSVEELLPLIRVEPARPGRAGAETPPRRFRRIPIDDRHTVYVGRSDEENDILTHEFAAPTDLWFHAQDVPGSHVILKGAHRSTPGAVIEKAAAIAAAFSKAKNSNTVPVIYAEKRHVRRPRKSKPGTAICQRGKTIFVKPGIPDEASED